MSLGDEIQRIMLNIGYGRETEIYGAINRPIPIQLCFIIACRYRSVSTAIVVRDLKNAVANLSSRDFESFTEISTSCRLSDICTLGLQSSDIYFIVVARGSFSGHIVSLTL